MGRLHLLEQEELLLRFRPHPLHYAPHYATSLLWILPGLAAALVAPMLGTYPGPSSAFLAAILALLVALTGLRIRRLGPGFAFFATGFFGAAGLLLIAIPAPLAGLDAWIGFGVGLLVAAIRLLIWEWDRLARLHHLTTQRLLINGGLRSRTERTIHVEKIQESRAARGIFGRLFDYGDLTLVFSKRLREKGGHLEDAEILRGIAALSSVKHEIDQLLAEAKLPAKDRRRRLEERRVKDSMRLLASWMRSERARGRT